MEGDGVVVAAVELGGEVVVVEAGNVLAPLGGEGGAEVGGGENGVGRVGKAFHIVGVDVDASFAGRFFEA